MTPAGGHLTCGATLDKPFKGKVKLTEQNGKYHFRHYGAHDDDDTDTSDFRMRTVVSMPGKVTRSSLGKVRGDKVILEDLDFLTYGIEITAEKKAAGPASSSGLSGKKTDASSLTGGFPVRVWAVVSIGAPVVIAGLAPVAGRRRGMIEMFSDGSLFRPTGLSAGRGPTNGDGGEDLVSSLFDARGV